MLLIELTGIRSLRAVLTFAVEAGLELRAADTRAAGGAETRSAHRVGADDWERAETLTATAESVLALPARAATAIAGTWQFARAGGLTEALSLRRACRIARAGAACAAAAIVAALLASTVLLPRAGRGRLILFLLFLLFLLFGLAFDADVQVGEGEGEEREETPKHTATVGASAQNPDQRVESLAVHDYSFREWAARRLCPAAG
jgi:hypothetical protein